MVRRLRIQYENALYHVINRGNYRTDVFASPGASGAFQTALGEACECHGWRLHAYVVMRNHYHLALETPQPNLVEGMHWLQSTFATRFNRLRSENGHLFQGRYRALLVEDEPALCRVIDYIHLNPVRVGIVSAHQVAHFAGCSLSAFSKRPRPAWLVDDVLRRQRHFEDTEEGWAGYVQHLRALAVAPADPARDQLSCGWAIGSLGWKRAVAREYAHLALAPGLPAEENRDLQQACWRRRLEEMLVDLGKTKVDVHRDSAHAPWKLELALRLRHEKAVPYRWIAEELNLGNAESLRVRLWRYVRV